MGLIKRILGLLFLGTAALWELRYEAIRGILYERGWTMLTEYLDAEMLFHYGIPVALVALGIALFVWSRPLKEDAANTTILKSELSLNETEKDPSSTRALTADIDAREAYFKYLN